MKEKENGNGKTRWRPDRNDPRALIGTNKHTPGARAALVASSQADAWNCCITLYQPWGYYVATFPIRATSWMGAKRVGTGMLEKAGKGFLVIDALICKSHRAAFIKDPKIKRIPHPRERRATSK